MIGRDGHLCQRDDVATEATTTWTPQQSEGNVPRCPRDGAATRVRMVSTPEIGQRVCRRRRGRDVFPGLFGIVRGIVICR